MPYWTPRLVYAEPYLYACCAEGGVCVLETVPAGVNDERRVAGGFRLSCAPSVTSGRLLIESRELRAGGRLAVFDVAGKEVLRLTAPSQHGEMSGRWPVDLSRLSTGVYVLRLEEEGVIGTGKVIITRR